MPRRIMIVDDVATNRILLKARLASAYHDGIAVADGIEALRCARAEPPDLFVIDYRMPGMDGLTLCRTIRADPLLSGIPVIMVSADTDDAARLAALRAGADVFLPKPVSEQLLLARIRALLRQRETVLDYGEQLGPMDLIGLAEGAAGFATPARIALVSTDLARAVRWRTELAAHLSDRIEVVTPAQALVGAGPAPDLFILAADSDTPGEELQVMSELRSRSDTRHAGFCVAIPPNAAMLAATALDMGADDVFAVPFDGRELALRSRALIARKRAVDRQREQIAKGWQMALTDPLTGLHNRRHALPVLARMVAEAHPCTVMVIDIDRFKAVNDCYGHPVGDAVLVAVARRLAAATRPQDMLARIGGEEFLLALPSTTLAEARGIAQRLCKEIGTTAVQVQDRPSVAVTISVGVAQSSGPHDTPDRLTAAADEALLQAKGNGRNRVVAHICRPAA